MPVTVHRICSSQVHKPASTYGFHSLSIIEHTTHIFIDIDIDININIQVDRDISRQNAQKATMISRASIYGLEAIQQLQWVPSMLRKFVIPVYLWCKIHFMKRYGENANININIQTHTLNIFWLDPMQRNEKNASFDGRKFMY